MTQVSNKMNRVRIVGAGAMGAIYIKHFADVGIDVRVVMRGTRATALRDHGLIINGESLTPAVCNPDEPDSIGAPADLIMIAVKHHQLDAALVDVAPLVDDSTTFLSVLNGLDSEEAIGDRFGAHRVLPCIALAMDAAREGNRISFHNAGRLVFGENDNTNPSGRVLRVQELLDRAQLQWETPANMTHELWWKFMVNVGINQASALLRAPYGAFVAAGSPKSLMDNLINEVVVLSGHAGVNLGATDLDRWRAVLAGQLPSGKTSMLQDIEARRPTEVEIFAGRVLRMGRQYNVATPYNQCAYDILTHWSDRQNCE